MFVSNNKGKNKHAMIPPDRMACQSSIILLVGCDPNSSNHGIISLIFSTKISCHGSYIHREGEVVKRITHVDIILDKKYYAESCPEQNIIGLIFWCKGKRTSNSMCKT
jgi:hypothetical protein